MTTTSARGLSHLPALDGVRAIAVLAVLAFHGGLTWAAGGFLGVDVFFALSGYLITALLLAEHARTGRIALGAFWRRRAARLLPALLLVVAVVLLGARAVVPPEDLGRLRGDGLAALLYVANWRMASDGDDYFAQTAAPSLLQHTWSLGIEEQFYLVWPLLLVLLLARSGSAVRRARWRVLGLCAAGVVVSSVLLAALHRSPDPARAYYGTDSRGASLLVGAALAVLLGCRSESVVLTSRRLRQVLSAAALVAVAWLVWAAGHADGSDLWLYRGGLLAVAVAVATVLAHVVLVPDGWLAWLLSRRALVLLGLVSYGVYLWHWPVFIAVNAARTGRTGVELFALRVLVAVALATFSYLVVERPLRALGRAGRPRLLAGAGLAAVASAVAVVVVAPTALPAASAGAAVLPVTGARDGIKELGNVEPPPEADPAPGRRRPAPWRHHPRPGRVPVVSVFGDSMAWTLVSYLPETPGLDVRDRTMLGCGVARSGPYRYFGQLYPSASRDCRDWPRLWERAIAADDPDVAFILVGRWETMDRQVEGEWGHVGQPAFDGYLRSELELAIRTAGAHGARVVLATEPYNRRGERLDGSIFPEDEPERVTAWNALLRDVADDHHRVRVVELGTRLSPDGEFTWTAGGLQVRSDGVHFTPSGVERWIAPWLVPQLRAAVAH